MAGYCGQWQTVHGDLNYALAQALTLALALALTLPRALGVGIGIGSGSGLEVRCAASDIHLNSMLYTWQGKLVAVQLEVGAVLRAWAWAGPRERTPEPEP